MQFHQNGFRAGDPTLFDAAPSAPQVAHRPAPDQALPSEADVVIIGCGPAGLTLAAQLAAFPEIKTVIVDQKSGPLQVGQADGIACRTMEMFEAFGFVERVLKESYWVNETTFWKPAPDKNGEIARSGRVKDVEDGLSHMPHVILNQARVHDFYLDVMARSPSRLAPHYGRKLHSVVRDADESQSHPVTVKLERQGERQEEGQEGNIESIRARYVVGCDGARSGVRQSMGRELLGDSANKAWGVMDILVHTDFPDIRFKALIQSENEGSAVLIPREGGYMVRLYVELDKLNSNERVGARNISLEQLIAAAQRIFRPYTLDVKQVAWWSVYEIGQRLCDKFDDVAEDKMATQLPRIFISGDACHTHSPKAGQGMNVSMQDAFNLGWKLAAVLRGQSPHSLLHSYSAERQAIAKTLIEFDREWAAMLSKPLRKPSDPQSEGVDAAEVQNYFVQHGRYTAGTATQYAPGLLIGGAEHQLLATGLRVGTRFHSAEVIRIGDGRLMQLGETLTADTRWRLMMFAGAGDAASNNSPVRALCDWLAHAEQSPMKRYAPAGADVNEDVNVNMDTVFDCRAVFQQSHHALPITAMPALLFPSLGKLGLRDYEKAFCALTDAKRDIYAMRGINRQQGCLVIVRPDQYIAQVLPLTAREELTAFFEAFMQSHHQVF